MSYKTSNKKKKSVTRLIVSMLTLLSILVTTLSIPIDAYANDIVQVNNDSDTDDQNTTSSSGRKNLVISTPTNANRNNAFWVCYIANTSGEMVTDPFIVFPDGFTSTQINKVKNADTSLLKCHLDTSVAVENGLPEPVAGLPAPAAGREDGSNLNRAFMTGAVNYKDFINKLTNHNQTLYNQIMQNADDYYIVCEVSGLTTHRSSSNRKITHSVNNPFISINITRTLPDGCTGFHLEYETISVTDTDASVYNYMRLWNSLYYNGELVLPNNRSLREGYKNQLLSQIRYSHQGNFIDPRYPIKVVFDGDYKMYAATCLGWSMDESWWDSSQAWLWNTLSGV